MSRDGHLGDDSPGRAARPCDHLQANIAISRQMLEAASEGDWVRVEALQVRREARLYQHDSGLLDPTLRSELETLRELNERIISLATTEREQRRRQLEKTVVGRRASNAYKAAL